MICKVVLVLALAQIIVAGDVYQKTEASPMTTATSTYSPTKPTPPSQSVLDEGTEICKRAAVKCPRHNKEEATYHGIDNNTKFCQCSNGRPYLFICPPGTVFNGENNCAYAEVQEEEEEESDEY